MAFNPDDYQLVGEIKAQPDTPFNPDEHELVGEVQPVTSAYAQKGRDINAEYKAWQANQAKKAATPAETTPAQKKAMADYLQAGADAANPMMVGQGGLTPENVQTQAGAYKLQGIAQEQQAGMRSDLYGKSEKEARAWTPMTLEYMANPEISPGAKVATLFPFGVSLYRGPEINVEDFSSPEQLQKAYGTQMAFEFLSNPMTYLVGSSASGLPLGVANKVSQGMLKGAEKLGIKDLAMPVEHPYNIAQATFLKAKTPENAQALSNMAKEMANNPELTQKSRNWYKDQAEVLDYHIKNKTIESLKDMGALYQGKLLPISGKPAKDTGYDITQGFNASELITQEHLIKQGVYHTPTAQDLAGYKGKSWGTREYGKEIDERNRPIPSEYGEGFHNSQSSPLYKLELENAIKYADEKKIPVTYVDFDHVAVKKWNSTFSNPVATARMKAESTIIGKHLDRIGAHVKTIKSRQGGDEGNVVILGATRAQVDEAMKNAQKEIDAWHEAKGTNIAHTHGGKGYGIVYHAIEANGRNADDVVKVASDASNAEKELLKPSLEQEREILKATHPEFASLTNEALDANIKRTRPELFKEAQDGGKLAENVGTRHVSQGEQGVQSEATRTQTTQAENGQGTAKPLQGISEEAQALLKAQEAATITKSSPTGSPVISGEGQVIDASFNINITEVKHLEPDEGGYIKFGNPDSIADNTEKLGKVFHPDILANFEGGTKGALAMFYRNSIQQPLEAAELLAKNGYKTSLYIMQRMTSYITRTAKRQHDLMVDYAEPLEVLYNKMNPKQREDLVKAIEVSKQENRLLERVEYESVGLKLNNNQMDYLIFQQQSYAKIWDDMVTMLKETGKPDELIQEFIANSKGYFQPTTRKGDVLFMVFDNKANKVIASVGSKKGAEYKAVLEHLTQKFSDAETYSIKTMVNTPSKYEGEEISMMMFEKLRDRAQRDINGQVDEMGGLIKDYPDLKTDPSIIAMQNAIKQRGPGYLKKKKDIAGYDTDFHQQMKEYYASVSGYIENQLFKHDLYDTRTDASGNMIGLWHQLEKEQGPKSNWKDKMKDDIDYAIRPTEEFAQTRALMFNFFLATNPSSVLLQFSNILTTLIPSLTAHGAGIGNAEKQVALAIGKLTHKDKFLRDDEKQLIEYMTENGDINQFLRSELTGHSAGQISDFGKKSFYREHFDAKTVAGRIGQGTTLLPRMLTTTGGQAFSNLDQYTRIVAGISYYNTALKLMKEQPKQWEKIKNELHLQGFDDFSLAADFASKGSKQTMFDYSKINLPGIAKWTVKGFGGKEYGVGRVLFQFKMFGLVYAKLLFSLTGNALKSPAQFSAAVKAWGILVTLSGVGGVPFGKYIDALVDDVTGQDTNHWIKKYFGDNFVTKTLGRGILSNFGVDVAKRLGISVVPEISESNKDKTKTEKILHTLAISAPAIGFAMNIEQGAFGSDMKMDTGLTRGLMQLTGIDRSLKMPKSKFTAEENIIKGLEKMSPTGIANVFKVLRWTIDGDTVRDKNNKVIISHVTASEKLTKLLGFMPERMSETYSRIAEQKSGK